jgi:GT2 family glycosyltransferase
MSNLHNASRYDVSVILVSWNTRELLLACLAALPAALGNLAAEIWVVDNGSTDGSVAAVHDLVPGARVIENAGNPGFAAANNQAIVASSGRYALLLNSDTVPEPGAIDALVRFAEQHARAGIVGAMLLNPDRSFQASYAGFPTLWSETLSVTGMGVRLFGRWYPNAGLQRSQVARCVDYVQGACMLVRRAAIADAGLMDEHYFMYSEEPDWCLRMRRAGWQTWYTPDARIVHHGGQSTRQARRAMVQALYRSKVRFFRLHRSRAAALALQAIFVAALRIKHTLSALSDRHANPPIGWRDLHSSTGSGT